MHTNLSVLGAVCALAATQLASAAEARSYRVEVINPAMIDTRLISQYDPIQTRAVNNNGQVVGHLRRYVDSTPPYGFVWENGRVTRVKAAPEGSGYSDDSEVYDINDAGELVFAQNLGGHFPGGEEAFLWHQGETTRVTGLFETGVVATALNNNGDMAGWSRAQEGTPPRAVIWEENQPTELGTLSADVVERKATAINDNKQVVGVTTFNESQSLNPYNRLTRAFLWDDGTMRDLGALDAGVNSTSYADDINGRGQIVGSSYIPDGNGRLTLRAVLWENGEIENLGTLPDGVSSKATAIAGDGTVVGGSRQPSPFNEEFLEWHGFIWDNESGMRDLNEMISPSEPLKERLLIESAIDINERGQILARGRLQVLDPDDPDVSGFTYYNVLLTPASSLRDKDSDADGVVDAYDRCLATAANVPTSRRGCSLEQLVPCAGPGLVATHTDWQDKQTYLNTLRWRAYLFVRAGHISWDEMTSTIRQAEQNACGVNASVTDSSGSETAPEDG